MVFVLALMSFSRNASQSLSPEASSTTISLLSSESLKMTNLYFLASFRSLNACMHSWATVALLQSDIRVSSSSSRVAQSSANTEDRSVVSSRLGRGVRDLRRQHKSKSEEELTQIETTTQRDISFPNSGFASSVCFAVCELTMMTFVVWAVLESA